MLQPSNPYSAIANDAIATYEREMTRYLRSPSWLEPNQIASIVEKRYGHNHQLTEATKKLRASRNQVRHNVATDISPKLAQKCVNQVVTVLHIIGADRSEIDKLMTVKRQLPTYQGKRPLQGNVGNSLLPSTVSQWPLSGRDLLIFLVLCVVLIFAFLLIFFFFILPAIIATIVALIELVIGAAIAVYFLYLKSR